MNRLFIRKTGRRLIALVLVVTLLSGCGLIKNNEMQNNAENVLSKEDKYRTFYEVFVYSFYDSDGDGIGDLKGLTDKLDYINDGNPAEDSDLGANGIWLMPIMPSNTYHKYDVKDYFSIDPDYGTMEDFDAFLKACDERGINVILDLVMNHTSSEHPWFQQACDYLRTLHDEEPDLEKCPYVGYYNFSKGMKWGYSKVEGAEDWYYEAGFWSEMPDLNLYNEDVRSQFREICKFWLDKGVAGFRLDAVKEFVSDDTEANVEILSWLNGMVKELNPDAYLVGEAWTSQPEYAKYYASGLDSLFDFAFAGENGYIRKFADGTYQAKELVDYIQRGERRFAEQNENYINAPFYSNHDMDRAAGYYSGAHAAEQIKMAAALNMTMSGNVFLYYGDEIGMVGSGRDENKRLAMYWQENTEAEGMCDGPREADWSEGQLYPALEYQKTDENSIYYWYRELIHLRNRHPAIRKGSVELVEELSNGNVCCMIKQYENEKLLLAFNLSESTESLDMNALLKLYDYSKKGLVLQEKMSAGEGDITIENELVQMPGYSMAVFGIE